jgi:hypothetical protein
LLEYQSNPLLLALIESGTIFGLALERFLTSLRAALLELALLDPNRGQSENILQFCCALARQCYINEYVFDVTREENEQAHKLGDRIKHAFVHSLPIQPIEIALFAAYSQLDSLPRSALFKRAWPKCIAGLLTEQIEEPESERKLRDSIPRITRIADGTSVAVKEQYEENPFPRWVSVPFSRRCL